MNKYELVEARTIRNHCRNTLWHINQQKGKYGDTDPEFELLLEEIVERLEIYKNGPDKCPAHRLVIKNGQCKACVESPWVKT